MIRDKFKTPTKPSGKAPIKSIIAAGSVKAVTILYTLLSPLNAPWNRLNKISTIARGYRNIKAGIENEIILFKPTLAIPKDIEQNKMA